MTSSRRISPLTMRAIREVNDAIGVALADPDRPRAFSEFQKALLDSNPYSLGEDMRHPWHNAMATQLIAVRARTWRRIDDSGEGS